MFKQLIFAAVLFVLCAVLLLTLIQETDQTAQTWRQFQVQQRMTEANRLAPIIFAAKVIVIGAGACSVALLLLGATCVLLYFLVKRVQIVVHLVFPNRAGLMPGIVVTAATGYTALPPNESGAQIMAASVASRNGRGRMTAAQIRAAREDWQNPETPLVAELEPALPTSVPIYSAALPSTLSLPVGVAAGNEAVAYSLRNLGNIVVGGLQGYGKSELLAAMIVGLLRQDASGQLWRLGLIDMKGADFCRLPPDLSVLQWPVVRNDVPGALSLLSAAQAEYDSRNAAFGRADVPNIETYNRRIDAPLPYILIVVDEIMFLTGMVNDQGMPKADRELSAQFVSRAVRLGAVARNAGMIFCFATQRPSAEVIPTTLRDICGVKIAFRCATVEASKAVLGQGGAEKIPDVPGRALVFRGGTPQTVQTYMAGLEAGEFDRFLSRMPRSAPPPALPVSPAGSVSILDNLPTKPPATAGSVSVLEPPAAAEPVVIPVDRAPQPPRETEAVFQIWRQIAKEEGRPNLNETQRRIYGKAGGTYHDWAALAINDSLRRRGKPRLYSVKESTTGRCL